MRPLRAKAGQRWRLIIFRPLRFVFIEPPVVVPLMLDPVVDPDADGPPAFELPPAVLPAD